MDLPPVIPLPPVDGVITPQSELLSKSEGERRKKKTKKRSSLASPSGAMSVCSEPREADFDCQSVQSFGESDAGLLFTTQQGDSGRPLMQQGGDSCRPLMQLKKSPPVRERKFLSDFIISSHLVPQ